MVSGGRSWPPETDLHRVQGFDHLEARTTQEDGAALGERDGAVHVGGLDDRVAGRRTAVELGHSAVGGDLAGVRRLATQEPLWASGGSMAADTAGFRRVELYAGDATQALTPEEVAAAIRALMPA